MPRRGLMIGACIVVGALTLAALTAPRPETDNTWVYSAVLLIVAAMTALRMEKRRVVAGVIIGVLLLFLLYSLKAELPLLERVIVWSFLIVIAAVSIAQLHVPVCQYVFFLRFPIALWLFLFCYPLIATSGMFRAYLRNTLVMNADQLIVVSLLALFASWGLTIVASLVARHAHERFRIQRWDRPLAITNVLGALHLSAWPIMGVSWWLCEATAVEATLSLAIAVLVFWFSVRIVLIASTALAPAGVPEHDVHAFPRTFIDNWAEGLTWPRATTLRQALQNNLGRQPKSIRAGYTDRRSGQLHAGYLRASVLFLLTAGAYSIGYWVFHPGSGYFELPALAYILVLAILLTWLLTSLSFFLDKFRIPAVVSLMLAPLPLYFINDIDHYYRVHDGVEIPLAETTTETSQVELRQSFRNRRKAFKERHQEGGETIIAVAASGGGITAAMWTAEVLSRLEAEYGRRFVDSIHVISAVSGGSLGAMYFLDSLEKGEPVRDKISRIVDKAGTSALGATAWGVAYPDFWRGLSFQIPFDTEGVDRGWALETAWRKVLGKAVKLSEWRQDTLDGVMPAVLFNATLAETGERFVISPLRIDAMPDDCPQDEDARCRDAMHGKSFSSLYVKNDLDVTTAVRLSATFPFVSPIARPRVSTRKSAYHVADGGYYDNYGVVTAIEWIRHVFSSIRSESPRPRVLLVQIRNQDRKAPREARDRAGWIYEATGPISTMLQVRQSSQVARNDIDVMLMGEWARALGVEFSTAVFSLGGDAPMSWNLDTAEREAIREYWKKEAAGADSPLGSAMKTVKCHMTPCQATETVSRFP